jgi:hypothetical protein
MEHANIVAKIVKLLALAKGRGATPHEAAAAASAVQTLLLEHELTMKDVEAAARSPYTEERPHLLSSSRYRQDWESCLVKMISEHCLCLSVHLCPGRQVSVIGRAHQVAVAIHLIVFLRREIVRLARIQMPPMWKRSRREKWERNFAFGVICTVRQRLEQQRTAMPGEVTALVRRSDLALRAEVARRFPRATDGKKIKPRVSSAYVAGRFAGAGIPLSHAVAGPAPPIGALAGEV